MSAESIGQTAFLGLRGRETLNRPIPARLAAPWTKTRPKWAKTLPRQARLSIGGVGIGEAKRKFHLRLFCGEISSIMPTTLADCLMKLLIA